MAAAGIVLALGALIPSCLLRRIAQRTKNMHFMNKHPRLWRQLHPRPGEETALKQIMVAGSACLLALAGLIFGVEADLHRWVWVGHCAPCLWTQHAGAWMTSCGTVVASRAAYVATTKVEGHAGANITPAYVWTAVGLIVFGTLIWGFGDLGILCPDF